MTIETPSVTIYGRDARTDEGDFLPIENFPDLEADDSTGTSPEIEAEADTPNEEVAQTDASNQEVPEATVEARTAEQEQQMQDEICAKLLEVEDENDKSSSARKTQNRTDAKAKASAANSRADELICQLHDIDPNSPDNRALIRLRAHYREMAIKLRELAIFEEEPQPTLTAYLGSSAVAQAKNIPYIDNQMLAAGDTLSPDEDEDI